MQAPPGWVRVWDPFVRIFHWCLVLAFAVAYLTEGEGVHVWAGYAIGVLIVTRLAWGLVGPRRARFADFVRGPAATLAYLRDLLRFRAERHVGHSPAGGAMVVLLLLSLSATVIAGLVTYGAEEHAGPLAGLFAGSAPSTVEAVADDEDSDEEGRSSRKGGERGIGKAAKEVHEFLANVTLALVILHTIAVVFASVEHRENLVRAMITGLKRR